MFLACNFRRIDLPTEDLSHLIKILNTQGEVYTYKREISLDEENLELKILVRSRASTVVGKLIEVYYEDFVYIHTISHEKKEVESKRAKTTFGPFYIHLFDKEPLKNYMGFLTRKIISTRLSTIFSQLLTIKLSRRVIPFRQIRILITQKEKEIRDIDDFHNVSEVIIEDIEDQYVDWAWMKGSMLDLSEEYTKYIQRGGKVRSLAIEFRGRTYYLYNDGRIYTKQADTSSLTRISSEIGYFYEIAKRLQEIGAFTVI